MYVCIFASSLCTAVSQHLWQLSFNFCSVECNGGRCRAWEKLAVALLCICIRKCVCVSPKKYNDTLRLLKGQAGISQVIWKVEVMAY